MERTHPHIHGQNKYAAECVLVRRHPRHRPAEGNLIYEMRNTELNHKVYCVQAIGDI